MEQKNQAATLGRNNQILVFNFFFITGLIRGLE